MYFCGPTVYARAHIGNARPFVIGMWLRSWLRATGYEVNLVHNITDVNDKIYDAAPGASAALAKQATEWYLEDTGGFGLGMPDELPKVTDYVPEIVAFIGQLVERGFAYPVDGDVYFRVASFPEYGRLSGQRPDQVEEQEPNARKEDPRDFALWKANKPGEDTHWPSPWGEGRPGWHIECSAMAEALLGPAFEIHGGGLDLVFPHHENEVAQSRALGHPFAEIWAHNGLLQLTGDKMSKSSGNIATIQEVLEDGGARRRSSSSSAATGASRSTSPTRRWRRPPRRPRAFARSFAATSAPAAPDAWERFAAALEDDFNTPAALAIMHEWRDHDLLRAGSRGVRPRVARRARRSRRPRSSSWPSAVSPHGPSATSRPRTSCGPRSRTAGWEMRDEPDGYTLVPRA